MPSTVPQSDSATVDRVWNRGKRRPKTASQCSTTMITYICVIVVEDRGALDQVED